MKAINGYVLLEPVQEQIGGFEMGASTSFDYKKAKVVSAESDELMNSSFVLLTANPKTLTYKNKQYYLVKATDIALIEEA